MAISVDSSPHLPTPGNSQAVGEPRDPWAIWYSIRQDEICPKLSTLLTIPEDEKATFITKHKLTPIIKEFGSESKFWDTLKKADQEMLKTFTVADLKSYFSNYEKFKIPLTMQPTQEIARITIKEFLDIPYVFNGGQKALYPLDMRAVLRQRLLRLESTYGEESYDDIKDMPFAAFLRMSPSFLNEHAPSIPNEMYSFLSPEQAKAIDLEKLTDNQLREFLFTFSEELGERMRRVPVSYLSRTINHANQQWSECSDEQISHLDLNLATNLSIYFIFNSRGQEKTKSLFALVPNYQVNANLSKFDSFIFSGMSEKQWKGLYTELLTREMFSRMFIEPEFEEAKQRVAWLSADQKNYLKEHIDWFVNSSQRVEEKERVKNLFSELLL